MDKSIQNLGKVEPQGLKHVPTYLLVEELVRRKDFVTSRYLGPDEDFDDIVEGPAVVLIVTD